MELLTTLTLIYAAVLVLALAASLITIVVYLWKIGTVLAEVGESLEIVSDRTAAMGDPLTRLEEITRHVDRELKASVLDLAYAGDDAGIIAEEPVQA